VAVVRGATEAMVLATLCPPTASTLSRLPRASPEAAIVSRRDRADMPPNPIRPDERVG
jgi:hypothetical protein